MFGRGFPPMFVKQHIGRHTRIIHIIQNDNPCSKSFAGALALWQQLRSQDSEYLRTHWRTWLHFRNRWMRTQEKSYKGTLQCVYCGKRVFRKYKTLGLLATVDHVQPISKGGERYNPDNLAIACFGCNHRKGDEVWELKHGREQTSGTKEASI